MILGRQSPTFIDAVPFFPGTSKLRKPLETNNYADLFDVVKDFDKEGGYGQPSKEEWADSSKILENVPQAFTKGAFVVERWLFEHVKMKFIFPNLTPCLKYSAYVSIYVFGPDTNNPSGVLIVVEKSWYKLLDTVQAKFEVAKKAGQALCELSALLNDLAGNDFTPVREVQQAVHLILCMRKADKEGTMRSVFYPEKRHTLLRTQFNPRYTGFKRWALSLAERLIPPAPLVGVLLRNLPEDRAYQGCYKVLVEASELPELEARISFLQLSFCIELREVCITGDGNNGDALRYLLAAAAYQRMLTPDFPVTVEDHQQFMAEILKLDVEEVEAEIPDEVMHSLRLEQAVCSNMTCPRGRIREEEEEEDALPHVTLVGIGEYRAGSDGKRQVCHSCNIKLSPLSSTMVLPHNAIADVKCCHGVPQIVQAGLQLLDAPRDADHGKSYAFRPFRDAKFIQSFKLAPQEYEEECLLCSNKSPPNQICDLCFRQISSASARNTTTSTTSSTTPLKLMAEGNVQVISFLRQFPGSVYFQQCVVQVTCVKRNAIQAHTGQRSTFFYNGSDFLGEPAVETMKAGRKGTCMYVKLHDAPEENCFFCGETIPGWTGEGQREKYAGKRCHPSCYSRVSNTRSGLVPLTGAPGVDIMSLQYQDSLLKDLRKDLRKTGIETQICRFIRIYGREENNLPEQLQLVAVRDEWLVDRGIIIKRQKDGLKHLLLHYNADLRNLLNCTGVTDEDQLCIICFLRNRGGGIKSICGVCSTLSADFRNEYNTGVIQISPFCLVQVVQQYTKQHSAEKIPQGRRTLEQRLRLDDRQQVTKPKADF
jgi:hypothetical protein